MVRSIRVRPRADQDIENIADYSIAQWGEQRAEAYVLAIRQAIEALTATATRHPIWRDESNAIRRLRSGSHLIFYRVTGRTVIVMRVLHERMDPGIALG